MLLLNELNTFNHIYTNGAHTEKEEEAHARGHFACARAGWSEKELAIIKIQPCTISNNFVAFISNAITGFSMLQFSSTFG